ncbi:MAG: type II toxin-antitoxin system Phd/YefM family antitoxin [Gemmatimonadaceae bacterium]
MKTASISELKARLSAYLDAVRQGDEVLVTDRGRPVARLAPVRVGRHQESRRDLLVRTGRLRAPTAVLPKDLLTRRLPDDRQGRSLAALLAERESGL